MTPLVGTYRARTLSNALIVRMELDGQGPLGTRLLSGDLFDNDFSINNFVASFVSTRLEVSDDGTDLKADLTFPGLQNTAQLQAHSTDPLLRTYQASLRILNPSGVVISTHSMTLERS